MKSKVPKLIKKKDKEFEKLRTKLLPEGTVYYLIKPLGRTSSFTIVLHLPNCFHKFNSYREQTYVQIASNDAAIVDAIDEASDIAIGVGTSLQVYQIDKRDVVPPDGARPWWELFCRYSGERFILP